MRGSQVAPGEHQALRVVVAAGGTAGHVVPALAVADELRARGAEVSFIGAEGRIETELVPAAGYPIEYIKVSGLARRNPIKASASAMAALGASRTARKLLREAGAQVVLGGGGFVVGPVGMAARRLKIPLVLTEADRHLGLANRMLAKKAEALCLAYPDEELERAANVRVTGRAIPRAILSASRHEARERFGIGPVSRCVLIMGGSQGARSINLAAIDAFAADLGRDFHVLHLAGRRDYPELQARLLDIAPRDYTLLEYEPDLGDCLAACDLVVARSGGSIFEVLALARPSILIPYPHATGDHQQANAEWLEQEGAAQILADADLDGDNLATAVRNLLDWHLKLVEMSVAARELARPDAAARIADTVYEVAGVPAGAAVS